MSSSVPPSDGSPPRPERSAAAKILDNPWIVLALLFFVTAALGLPLLWISRAFSAPMKILLSIVVMLYTLLLLAVFWLIMAWCYGRITEAWNTL